MVPLSSPSFDWRFYRRLLRPGAQPPPPPASLEELFAAVHHRSQKRRRLCALELTISPGTSAGLVASREGAPVRLGCALFSLIREARLPKKISVSRLDGKMVKSVPKQFTGAASGVSMLSTDRTVSMHKATPYGPTSKVTLTLDEDKAARAGPAAVGVQLLGFIPQAPAGEEDQLLVRLREVDNTGTSWFLYPEESLRTGSVAAFSALHAAMLRRRVVGLGVYTRATTSAPRLVCVLPGELEEGGEQVLPSSQLYPPGLHLIPLPFQEDARDTAHFALPAKGEALAPSPEAMEAARALVTRLRLNHLPGDISNPALDKFVSRLEYYTLTGGDEVEECVEPEGRGADGTEPDIGTAEGACGEEACGLAGQGAAALAAELDAAVKACIPEEMEEEAAAPKRKATADPVDDSARAAKVARLCASGEELDKNVTLDDLKAYLRSMGGKVTGTKPVLLARAREMFDGQK